MSCRVLSCLVLSCLVLSCLVLSCLVLSCLVLSCLVLSCLVLSCLVLSCLVLSCLVSLSSGLVAAFSLIDRTPGIGVLRSLLFMSSLEHLSMGQARNPPTLGTTLCVSRVLMPTLAVQPQHVCHRQRDWAVSMGSYMQQDMDISEAPPCQGAPIPLLEYRSLHIHKLAIIFTETQFSFDECPNACFPGRQAPHVQNNCGHYR